MNLTVNRFFGLLAFVYLAVILLTVNSLNYLRSYQSEYLQLQKQFSEMSSLADVLRQSSDDLTRFARQYVVTGDKQYKESYEAILDIRNGLKQRPEKYGNIYWDLLEPIRSQRHPPGAKRSLESLMKTLPFDAYDYAKLAEAHKNSDDLVNIELEAFNAMVGLYKDEYGHYARYDTPDQQKAVMLLHSKAYLEAKEKIMLPIDEFLSHLNDHMSGQIDGVDAKINFHIRILGIMGLILILLFIGTLYAVNKKFLRPVHYLTTIIDRFKKGKKELPEETFYNDEFGYMIEQFIGLKEKVEDDFDLLKKNAHEIEDYVKLVDQNIITSSTDLAGRITYASEAFAHISGYTAEELMGQYHSILRHPDMPESVYVDLWKTITNDHTWRGELKNRTKEGGFYWVQATIYPKYNLEGKKIGYTAIRIDISARKLVEELLDEVKVNEKKIKDYVALVDKNVLTSSTDLLGRITYVSEAFARISGYTKEELIGKNHSIVRHPDMPASLYDELWDTITQNRTWHGELKNKTKNDGYYWVDATIYPIFDIDGNKIGYTAVRIDITAKKRVENLLITDAMTGVYNRRYFNEMLPKRINHTKRDRKYFSFIMMDIDHFKQYNDTYGHQEGDNVLVQVAQAVASSLKRSSDLCFRLGGEEFAVLCESLDPEEAYRFAERIRETIEGLQIPHSANSAGEYVTVSLGLLTKKITGDVDADLLYKEADDLLYTAKQNGRNRIEANIR